MSTTRMPRVVVGVSESLAGLAALRFAVAEARRRGVVLRAIRAWQYPPGGYGYVPGTDRASFVTEAAETVLTAFREAMGGLPRDIVVEALAIEGPPVAVLVTQSDDSDDLLVVGRPGAVRGWWARLRRAGRRLTGRSGVDVRCGRSAVCPVVMVGVPPLAQDSLARDVVSAAEALLRDGSPAQPA